MAQRLGSKDADATTLKAKARSASFPKQPR